MVLHRMLSGIAALRVMFLILILLMSSAGLIIAAENSSEGFQNPDEDEENKSTEVNASLPTNSSPTTLPIDFPVTITATPLSGAAPLSVQFISAAAGKPPLVYAWDFNNDSLPDSSAQNPSYVFEEAGVYSVRLSVIDSVGNSGAQVVAVTVARYDSGVNISSYFPVSVSKGQNQITFLIVNNGKETLRDLSAKIIADGVQQVSSTSISLLRPGDSDSLTISALFLKNGNIPGVLKIEEKNLPIAFTVKELASYNSSELQASFLQLKQFLKEQEGIYADKKAAGYLVTEVYDVIKTAQKQMQDVQQQLLTNKYGEAKLALDLANTTITDITESLQTAHKQKQSPLIWLKDNAVAITAIVAAGGTISGILLKVKNKASKLGENVKLKIIPVARRKEEEKTEINTEKVDSEKKAN